MKRILFVTLLGTLALGVPTSAPAAQLGAGLHYLRAVNDIDADDEIDKNDFAIFGSITHSFVMVRVEGQLEIVPDYLESGNALLQPAAYGLISGGLFYGGVGIGIGYLDGEWASDPFYALRAGVELGLGGLAVDAFLSYRFQSASFGEGVEDFDLDSVTLAAQVKFGG